MKKNKKLVRSTLASAVLLAISCHLLAKTGCEERTVAPAVVEEQLEVVEVSEAVIPEPPVPVETQGCDEPKSLSVVIEKQDEVVEAPEVVIPEPPAPVEPVDCDEPTAVAEEQHEVVEVPAVVIPEPQAPAEPVVAPEVAQEVDEPMFTELSDKLHQITQTLTNTASVHHYSFVSVRGQDVMLGTPELKTFNKLWKLEYQVDGGKWELKRHTNPNAHRGLKPGAVVNVRISAVEGAKVENAPYKIVLGSYPHMTYNLHHEDGLLRFPHNFEKPGFIATQALEKALLDVRFWDSKSAPLEGGLLQLNFEHFGPAVLDPITLMSGIDGTASKLLEFGKCEGGELAKNFTQQQEKGTATWASRYRKGFYTGVNVLLENLADKPHDYLFAHICNRFMIDFRGK